jgi:F0F1-type ATP synthase assembly protein I
MWRTVGNAGFVGVEILLALAVGYLGGQWVDGKLDTAPWFKWIGMVAGIGAAINALVRVVRTYNKSLANQDQGPGQDNDGAKPRS